MKAFLFAVGLLAATGVPACAAAASSQAGGAAIFKDKCAFCHQAGGVGVAGQFPRLESRIAPIAAAPEGREYLVLVLLNGMSGRVVVDGQEILGLMPSFAIMDDVDVAAVLNYISRLGKIKSKPVPFTAKEVAAKRGGPSLDPGAIAVRRANLVTENIIP